MNAKKRLSSTTDERRLTQIKTTDSFSLSRVHACAFAVRFWQWTKLFHLRSSAVQAFLRVHSRLERSSELCGFVRFWLPIGSPATRYCSLAIEFIGLANRPLITERMNPVFASV